MLAIIKRCLNNSFIFQEMNLKRCNRKWRNKNLNNYTTMNNIFDINCVEVGAATYGPLNINQFEKNNGKLKIGSYCSIAPNVNFLLDGEHYYKGFSTYPFKKKLLNEKETLTKGDIIIEDDVWIGFGATILSGVHIGQGAIIGANALISKDVPPYAIVCGVPARVIKYRFSDKIVNKLLKVDFSKIDKKCIKENIEYCYKTITEDNIEDILKKLNLNSNIEK